MVDESLQPAQWGSAVPDHEIATVQTALRSALPAAWRVYVQRERWLRKGWLESGAFVMLYDPVAALELMDAWDLALERHPGFYVLGGDGSRDMYCVDLRVADPPVLLTDVTSEGWASCEPLLPTVEAFVRSLDDGSFDPLD